MLHLPDTCMVIVLFILMTEASGTTITVGPSGCDYNSIQAAIDKASSGDTIEVMSGTYNESIDIKKQLILSGIDMLVLDAKSNGSTIILRADRCTIEGFNVINSVYRGIYLLSDFNTISNNTLMDEGNCIYLEKSHNNIITYNRVRAGGLWNSGLTLESSEYNIIKGNDISYNGVWGSGITLVNSNYNSLTDNRASAGGGGSGIYLDSSRNNNIKSNNVCCSIDGIHLKASHSNVIERNNADDIREGVFLYLGKDNLIKDNIANIQLIDSDQNTVSGNTGWVYYGTVTLDP